VSALTGHVKTTPGMPVPAVTSHKQAREENTVMSRFLFFNLVYNLNNYANYYFMIIIVPEKPHWGGSIHSFIT